MLNLRVRIRSDMPSWCLDLFKTCCSAIEDKKGSLDGFLNLKRTFNWLSCFYVYELMVPGGENEFYLYSLGSRRYPFLGVVYNWKLRNSHQFWNQRTSKVCLNFNSLSSSLRIDNHLEVHEFYFLGNWFLLNLAWVAPSFGYSFRFSTTQVTCAWITHGTYDLTSVSDRTVVLDPREGSGT